MWNWPHGGTVGSCVSLSRMRDTPDRVCLCVVLLTLRTPKARAAAARITCVVGRWPAGRPMATTITNGACRVRPVPVWLVGRISGRGLGTWCRAPCVCVFLNAPAPTAGFRLSCASERFCIIARSTRAPLASTQTHSTAPREQQQQHARERRSQSSRHSAPSFPAQVQMRDDVAPARVRCAPLCVLRFVAANGTLLASLHFRAAIVRFPILHYFLGLVWLCVLTVCVSVDELSALVRRGASDALNADAAAALRMVSFFFFGSLLCLPFRRPSIRRAMPFTARARTRSDRFACSLSVSRTDTHTQLVFKLARSRTRDRYRWSVDRRPVGQLVGPPSLACPLLAPACASKILCPTAASECVRSFSCVRSLASGMWRRGRPWWSLCDRLGGKGGGAG